MRKKKVSDKEAEKLNLPAEIAEPPASGEKTGNGMTIYDYEEKYVKRQNVKGAKFFLRLIISVLGIFLITCFVLISLKVAEINKYAGIGVGGACLIVFICVFIVPVVKIMKTGYFIVNVNSHTAKEAQRHNKELRNKIADKMIDFTSQVGGAGWYNEKTVGSLAIARKAGDNEKVKEILTEIYSTDVKSASRDMIVKCSVKSGIYSALSQSDKIDAAFIAAINLQMIKDIVFLYGFRPSDAGLLKIFGKVLRNSLIAYGLGNVKIGNGVAKTLGDMAKGLPLLGSAISVLVDSSVQGLVNGTLTAVIGYNTVKYLNKEYKLQDILDGIVLEDTDAELKTACIEVEQQLTKSSKRKVAKAS